MSATALCKHAYVLGDTLPPTTGASYIPRPLPPYTVPIPPMPNSGAETPRFAQLKETLIDTTKGAVHLAAVALSVAGSASQKVPYLGAISTVLTEVLKIIDEVEACKSAWKNLGSKIQKIQTVVDDFRSQCVGEGMTDEELPDMIKTAFKDFEGCLLKVITTMNDCKPNSKRCLDRARLLYKRSELKAAATQCGNEVDSALSIFHFLIQCGGFILGQTPTDLFKTIRDLSCSASFLLPSPSIFYGRSVEVDHVVDLVLDHTPACVAIVGSGGIGKTSIALTSIQHPEVEKYYQSVETYTQDHPDLGTTLSKSVFTQMAELYFDLIPTDDPSTTSSVVREDIHLEIGNITAVLDVCLAKYADVPRVVHKVLDFSDLLLRMHTAWGAWKAVVTINKARFIVTLVNLPILRAAARARDGHGRGIHGQSTARPVLYTAVRMIFGPPTGRHGSRHGHNGYTAIGQIFS
ncbi:hypothetical protein DFH09DRAFT_1459797 [Mycena vulgaris]|nr:hypothetical protein DFH09DRAFT_1459797 [Mycena vulgaris]